MEIYDRALFFCDNPTLLALLDEFLEVKVVKSINEMTEEDAQFLFLDSSVQLPEKVCCFSRNYINKNIIIFYCCALEELDKATFDFDDYISLPFSKNQVKCKLNFWKKKPRKTILPKSAQSYILEKIETFLDQTLAIVDRSHIAFQLSSIEWLIKFLHIDQMDLSSKFIDGIFDFVKLFLEKFNSKIYIKISFPIQSFSIIHQRNLLQVLLCLSRICCIYSKSTIKVKNIDKYIYIYLDKKPNLLKDYISCILFKKIVDQFKKEWQMQKLENGTLFKYTLFEDR